MKRTFKHVQNLWDADAVAGMDAVDRLVYRSNLLGVDWRITNTGGGNTSTKLMETDPLTGEQVEVLWVKGSGGDLRTAKRENFSSLYQDRLIALQDVYAAMPERGVKTPAEDQMVALYNHCTFNLNPRACSIDTPLHSFIPHPIVDHTHPAAVIALATAADGPELCKKVYGERVIWIDWQRPGFELGLAMQEVCRAHPQAEGILMGGHGLINWADTDEACYLLSLELIDMAADYLAAHDRGKDTFGGARCDALPMETRQEILASLLPWMRGKVSTGKRLIGTVEMRDELMTFVNSHDAARLAELGTSCPDHFLRTKIKPLYVDWHPQTSSVATLKEKLEAGFAQYQADYAAYYEACKHDNSPAIRISSPSVILIPGIGMVAFGKNKSESRVTAEFYNAAVEVMRGAESVSQYTALPRQEAFDIEYWLLEEAKLKRMPPEKELARRVVVVVGGGNGIGRAYADRVLKEGAAVVVVDRDASAAEEAAGAMQERVGMGIGVAGTGISGCGDVIGLAADMTDRAAVSAMLDQAVLAFGGFDSVVVTAGMFVAPDTQGKNADADWDRMMAVNVKGMYIVADEAGERMKAQGLSGSMVLTTSVNAVVPKRGSFPYDVSKSAANHLVRELAIEMAPHIRVNGVAPATVVEGSTMFPRDRVISSLAKYDLPYEEAESTETLRSRLATFYASRTLTKQPIRPADQAEALFLLTGERLSRTTGQIISVDGGLTDAFLR